MKKKAATKTANVRKEIRETEHRTAGSRQTQRPVERTDQSRKHGRHAGPREQESK
jgi:hypothetical protein